MEEDTSNSPNNPSHADQYGAAGGAGRHPPRVEYELTPLGCTLHQTIQSLVDWTERNQREIIAARAHYDAEAAKR